LPVHLVRAADSVLYLLVPPSPDSLLPLPHPEAFIYLVPAHLSVPQSPNTLKFSDRREDTRGQEAYSPVSPNRFFSRFLLNYSSYIPRDFLHSSVPPLTPLLSVPLLSPHYSSSGVFRKKPPSLSTFLPELFVFRVSFVFRTL